MKELIRVLTPYDVVFEVEGITQGSDGVDFSSAGPKAATLAHVHIVGRIFHPTNAKKQTNFGNTFFLFFVKSPLSSR